MQNEEFKSYAQLATEAAGVKHDGEKPRVELLDAYVLEQVGHVLSFGAKKYAAHNWRRGIALSRLVGASLRHIFAMMRGEELDPETGLPHWAHAICELMFAGWTAKFKPELNDLTAVTEDTLMAPAETAAAPEWRPMPIPEGEPLLACGDEVQFRNGRVDKVWQVRGGDGVIFFYVGSLAYGRTGLVDDTGHTETGRDIVMYRRN